MAFLPLTFDRPENPSVYIPNVAGEVDIDLVLVGQLAQRIELHPKPLRYFKE